MRERDGFAEVPVLIISALEARSDDALRGRHAHLTTPFDVQALLDTVRPLLAAR